MAKAPNGPLGPVKGKLGNVIFSSWLGTPYARINPGKRKEGNAKEKNTRKGFGELSWAFINPLKPLLQLSFREMVQGNRGMFAARSYLLKYAVERDAENTMSIIPSRMLISQGSLGQAENPQVEQVEEQELRFSWAPQSLDRNSSSNDQVLLVAYQSRPEKQQSLWAKLSVVKVRPGFL